MPVIKSDLLPNTEKSRKLISAIRNRIDMSWRSVSQSYDDWDIAEEHYRAYRPTDDKDVESLRRHGVQKIIVPIQFATVQTLLTFLLEVYTALKPVLKVRGADPASVRPSRVMELGLDYDYRGNRGYFMLYQWLLNMFRYGYSPMKNTWGVKGVMRKTPRQSRSLGSFTIEGQEFDVPGLPEYAREFFILFEGNKWEISDPRLWFPDPRYSISRFQEGEFCFERSALHHNDLIQQEKDGLAFNVTKISDMTSHRGIGISTGGGISEPLGAGDRRSKRSPQQALITDISDAKRRGMLVNEWGVMNIVPKEYELSHSEEVEPWLFQISGGTTITRAELSPFPKFPWSVVEVFPDILAFSTHGLMEFTQPLAAHLNFLFNSHMANVRKAINDMLIVDPSRVELADLLRPDAGKIIRLLPQAYGSDPGQWVKQLQVIDITQGHINDAKTIMELWQRITAVTDQMFGVVASGRRTATELQGVFRLAASRNKMLADLVSSEGLAPLTEQMALLRMENMSDDQFFEIAGRTAGELGVSKDQVIGEFVKVSRRNLTGTYLFPAEEGALPQDRAAAAEVMERAFDQVARSPFLQQIFDPVEMFQEVVRQRGLYNIQDFFNRGVRARTSLLSDEKVREMVAAGRLSPMGGGRPSEGKERQGLDVKGFSEGANIPSNGGER